MPIDYESVGVRGNLARDPGSESDKDSCHHLAYIEDPLQAR